MITQKLGQSIPARTMVMEAVRQAISRQIIGWKVYCLTCYNPGPLHPSIFMVQEWAKAKKYMDNGHVCASR